MWGSKISGDSTDPCGSPGVIGASQSYSPLIGTQGRWLWEMGLPFVKNSRISLLSRPVWGERACGVLVSSVALVPSLKGCRCQRCPEPVMLLHPPYVAVCTICHRAGTSYKLGELLFRSPDNVVTSVEVQYQAHIHVVPQLD